jgi:alkanesulfonate monooxygenase
MDGVHLSYDERYAQTHEFLIIWRRLFGGKVIDFTGNYLTTQGGRLTFDSVQRPYPPLWFGGSSDAGMDVAAEHADVYLTWAEPPAAVAEKLALVRANAAARGRKLRFGLRVHLIVRETEAEAWAAADRLIGKLSDAAIAAAQRRMLADLDSEGQRRQIALQPGPSRPAGDQSQPVGRHRPSAAGCRHRAGRQPGHGRAAAARIPDARDRNNHRIGLPASRGSLSHG